jgi:hypothetical protein
MSRPFCFTCESRRTREFVCRACGERECALCCDAAGGLCAACSYETEAARSLHELLAVVARS